MFFKQTTGPHKSINPPSNDTKINVSILTKRSQDLFNLLSVAIELYNALAITYSVPNMSATVALIAENVSLIAELYMSG